MGVGASALQHKEPASWPGRPALPWALSAQDSSAPSLTFPVRSGSPTQDTPFAQLQAAPVSWLSDYFPPIKPIMVYMQKKKKDNYFNDQWQGTWRCGDATRRTWRHKRCHDFTKAAAGAVRIPGSDRGQELP